MEALIDKNNTLKIGLRHLASNLGFPLFGVAQAEPLEEDIARLKAWISEGNAADMTFLENNPERRGNPALLLESARSVVMVGIPHAQTNPDFSPITGQKEGKIARFALGRDYHHIIRPRLEQMAQYLSEKTSGVAQSLYQVDSGPLLERAYAYRAGLGFIGKNNCLIHPVFGSWILLGALITSVEMTPDQPMGSQCHGCRMCLDACPTKALCEPYKLDARRCLSYWTIENHEVADPAIASHMGSRLFGCDTCQEVCPFNRASHQIEDPEFQPGQFQGQVNVENASLEAILNINSNRQFTQIFHGSSLTRARYKGLLRNALIAATHHRRIDLRKRIEGLANDQEKPIVIRQTAHWALNRLDNLLGY